MNMAQTTAFSRAVRAPRGAQKTAKGWIQEAAKRMLLNNLDPEVAEKPDELIVYGGRGKAARSWEDVERILQVLERLENDETLLVQSGARRRRVQNPSTGARIILANSNSCPSGAPGRCSMSWSALGLSCTDR
jgi:urocanate hydratase